MPRRTEYVSEEWRFLTELLNHARRTAEGMRPGEIVDYLKEGEKHYFSRIGKRRVRTRMVRYLFAQQAFRLMNRAGASAAELRQMWNRMAEIGFPNLIFKAGDTISLAKRYIAEGEPDAAAVLLRSILGQIRRLKAIKSKFHFEEAGILAMLQECSGEGHHSAEGARKPVTNRKKRKGG